MNLNGKKIVLTVIGCIIGVVIMLVPTIVTGFSYSNTNAMGGLIVSEFTMRVVSHIIGLLVIYDSIKTLNKSMN
ncbi:hypothetical protein [Clostridium culturomicium]|uniref:hypothetical protein n=1 Tax=Clostridium culturomicium TaxID=1499683 RepID=UPI000590F042|nr:hypothetical protein [Clostridium culturomicium]